MRAMQSRYHALTRASQYIKPNFPGRCGHICNHGFMVKRAHRECGIGGFMLRCALPLSKILGYRACYYNLVFTGRFYARVRIPPSHSAPL